jgi:hypothetical protein
MPSVTAQHFRTAILRTTAIDRSYITQARVGL